MVIKNKYINSAPQNPDGAWSDAIQLLDGQHHTIEDCIIDLSNIDIDNMDEALGITWGSSADVKNCVIKGAAKLILCGCGDKDKIPVEKGKTVTFTNCIFEDFSRRGPEVQDGMKVYLKNCLIQNWGYGDRFSVRSFGAWAHTEDSYIKAENCIFKQKKFFNGHFWADMIGHIGQAVNDSGFFRVFTKEAWQPGVCRALTATAGGEVEAVNCYKNHWWMSIQNLDGKMSKDEAIVLEASLEQMRTNLYKSLGVK